MSDSTSTSEATQLPVAEIVPSRLWHFTCADHGYRGLGKSGLLRPGLHPLMPELGPLVWLTDDPEPSRDDVGLSSEFQPCDRMAYRYEVSPAVSCVPWTVLRAAALRHGHGVTVESLESFGAPRTWWVSNLPLRASLSAVSATASCAGSREGARS